MTPQAQEIIRKALTERLALEIQMLSIDDLDKYAAGILEGTGILLDFDDLEGGLEHEPQPAQPTYHVRADS